MSAGESVAVPREEYERLLSYKEAYLDREGLRRKAGPAWRRYREYLEMDEFFKRRYGERWKAMKEAWRGQRAASGKT